MEDREERQDDSRQWSERELSSAPAWVDGPGWTHGRATCRWCRRLCVATIVVYSVL